MNTAPVPLDQGSHDALADQPSHDVHRATVVRPELRLVGKVEPTVVVCTTDGELLDALEQIATRPLLTAVDDKSLIKALCTHRVELVVVDSPKEGWNPHRLIRLAQRHRPPPAIWMMGNRHHEQTAALAHAHGARLVPRKLQPLLALIDPEASRRQQVDGMGGLLDLFDQAFLQSTGQMGQLAVQAARAAMALGSIAPTPDAYAHDLAARLRLPRHKEVFGRRVRELLARAAAAGAGAGASERNDRKGR
ncbi:MAG: hypothetical protein QM750_20015 [Rubrivivax sp.]